MSDLDLTEFFKEGSGAGPADLDWLDVNEQDYRALDTLPKQNLDVVPDLKAIWRHHDEPSTAFVPNTGGPRTMADLGDSYIRLAPEDIMRTARLAVYQSDDPNRVAHALTSRYDSQALQACKTALASVMAERGLLGRFYVDAADFPDCNKGGKQASEFVRRFSPDAQFVKAKAACKDCVHRTAYAEGMGHCGVFHKQIELEVPYTEELAQAVEQKQQAKGKAVQASESTPRERIKAAYLAGKASQAEQFTGRPQHKPKQAMSKMASNGQGLIAVAALTRHHKENERQKLAALKARPVVATLRREMLKGRSQEELATAIKLAHDVRDLQETRAQWEPIYKEAGLYGTVYSTQDSFDDCRVGADFLSKHGSKTKAIVSGSKCGPCIFNKVGRCMMYGKKLVKEAAEVMTQETVDQVIWEEKLAGHLPNGADRIEWGNNPREALKAIYSVASGPKPTTVNTSLRMSVERAFHGGQVQQNTGELTKRSILKSAAQFLNEGLYGQDLMVVLKSNYEVRDLMACASELKGLLSEQGLQGIKYIDPTVYDDYGHGCKTAQAKHRSRQAVRYAKVGSKCGSCVHQTTPGVCSVLSKQLVIEPPYIDKAAEQKAVLVSGRATETDYSGLMNNGLSMMAEYEIQHGSGDINLNAADEDPEVFIEFGQHDIKL